MVPTIQPEEAQLGSVETMLTQCGDNNTGDLFECEGELIDWLCIVSVKFKVFAARATQNGDAVSLPAICASPQVSSNAQASQSDR